MANSRWGGLDQFRWVRFSPGSADKDAFGRLRVSSPTTLFDSKLTLDNQPLAWDDQQTAGTASSTYDATDASVTLAVTSAATGTRVRQTMRRFNYQPGKSQLILMTGTIGAAVAGATKRWGLFDANNGVFFEQTSTGLRITERRATVDTSIEQAGWNGRLPAEFDITKSQIWWIDIEWLGVGTVRYGIWFDGVPVVLHVSHHANLITGTYMTTPNLPLRWSLSSSSQVNASLKAICASVVSEGGVSETGRPFATDLGITGFATGNNTDTYPVIALRLKSTHLSADVVLKEIAHVCTTTADYRWALVLNPTVVGTALSFSGVTNSAIEVAKPTNATTISGGTVLMSGYATGTATTRVVTAQATPESFRLGSKIDGTADIVVLALQNITSGIETYYAAINWLETF